MTKGTSMNLEIHEPELERRVRGGIESGRFHDVDELLTKALDALFEKDAGAPSNASRGRKTAGRTLFEQGLGLFGSPEDAALLDEVVSIAHEERRRPTKPLAAQPPSGPRRGSRAQFLNSPIA